MSVSCAFLGQRAELAQRALAVAHVAAVRRLDERKRLDVAELQRVHLQDHRGEIRALDLGLGEFRPREEVLFRIQADRDAGPDAAAAAGALVRRSLRDLLDGQSLQSAAMAVAADARDAGVDHRADARHRQRSLGHVGRQHDAAPARGPEHALLLFLREPRIQRQDLAALRVVFAQRLGGFADLALAAQEHQDVARLLAPQLVDRRQDRGLLVRRRLVVLFVELDRRGNGSRPGSCGPTH